MPQDTRCQIGMDVARRSMTVTRFALTIDDEACWGCRTCEAACKQEMHTRDGVRLIAVREEWRRREDGGPDFLFRVGVCRHCDEPPCMAACPEQAVVKRDDGIVVMVYERCSGCRACVDECPYDAIAFDPEKGIAQKCNLCHHRVDRGLVPACADNVCLARCVYFGDADGMPGKLTRSEPHADRTDPERPVPG